MTPADAEQIQARLAPLVGLAAWGVKLGVGSFVTLEFGRPLDDGGEVVHGEWHVWVYCCVWRLDGAEMIAGSNDPRERLAAAVAQLEGRTLEAFGVHAPAGQAELRFSGGYTLHLFPFDSEREHYQVYLPGGPVLVVGPGGRWGIEDA